MGMSKETRQTTTYSQFRPKVNVTGGCHPLLYKDDLMAISVALSLAIVDGATFGN